MRPVRQRPGTNMGATTLWEQEEIVGSIRALLAPIIG